MNNGIIKLHVIQDDGKSAVEYHINVSSIVVYVDNPNYIPNDNPIQDRTEIQLITTPFHGNSSTLFVTESVEEIDSMING